MLARLPIVYALLLLAGTAWLTHRFAVDPPAPADPLSVNLGWGGLLAMIVMLVYSIARRSRTLRSWARLAYWLHFHIFLGVAGVIMVSFHSLHAFTKDAPLNPFNPGFVNYVMVLVVFFSGLYGRWLYSTLPRAIGGEQLALAEVEKELAEWKQSFPPEVEALWKDAPVASSILGLLRADLATRAALRALRSKQLVPEALVLASRRLRLERKLAAMKAADRIFRRWIILHRPIAAIMYVVSAVHVILSYMFTPGL